MFTMQTQVQPHPAVLATTLSEGETVLLHVESSHYYSLNATGTQIWQAITQRHSLAAISQTLVDTYETTLAEAQQTVLDLLHELAAENLVQPVTMDAGSA